MRTNIIELVKKYLIYVSFLLNVLFVALFCWSCIKTNVINEILVQLGFKKSMDIPYKNKPEYLLAEAWANSLSKLGVEADAVFYGNSITYDSDFQSLFPNMKICNMGCKGDDLDDLINRSFVISCVKPKKIFVLGGINTFSQISLEEFKFKYQLMVEKIKKQNPTAQIYLQGMLPVNVNMLYGKQYMNSKDKIKVGNDIIKGIATSSGMVYIDLYSLFQEKDSLPLNYTDDGLHLNKEAYYIWANYIEKYLL